MNCTMVSIDELNATDRRDMRDLLDQHFAGVSIDQFELDLAGKTHAILLHDTTGCLVGFSTLRYHVTIDEQRRPLAVVYSGDTIVDPAAWGSSALLRLWVRSVIALHQSSGHGDARLMWLLISSGYRTYRFLPVFWQRFFPRYDQPTPEDSQQLIDRLADEQFGRQYDPKRGIVRFDQPQRLRSHLASVPRRKATDPHVAFFLRSNPGWRDGDELVCMTQIDPANLSRAGRRMLGERPAVASGAG